MRVEDVGVVELIPPVKGIWPVSHSPHDYNWGIG